MARKVVKIISNPNSLKRDDIEDVRRQAESHMLEIASVKKGLLFDIEVLKESITDLQENKDFIVSEIEKKRKDKASFENDFMIFSERIANEKKDIEDDHGSQFQKLKELKDKIILLGNELRDLVKNKGEIENLIKALESSFSNLSKTKDDLERTISSLNQKISEQEKTISKNNIEVKRLSDLIQDLNLKFSVSEFEKIRNEFDQLLNDIKVKESEKLSLNNELVILKEGIEKEKTVFEAAKAEADEKLRLVAVAETRLQEKVDFFNRAVEESNIGAVLKKKLVIS